MVFEVVVVSGKGGTGKTSVVASFAALAKRAVLADCDVDAADLHLVIAPDVRRRTDFSGGLMARIRADRCTDCGICEEVCRFDALVRDGPGNAFVDATYRIDAVACEGCGVCAHFCPSRAVELYEAVNGEWFVSDTRFGPMVHARLGVAEENSGKLVTTVRKEAKRVAEESHREMVIIDASPGIGCPVIASVTGATMALVVTEPTLSGLHDLGRVAALTTRFRIPTTVCVNKSDINREMTDRIMCDARSRNLEVLGEIPYDPDVTRAQIAGLTVVEYGDGPAATAIRDLWSAVNNSLPEPAGLIQLQTKGWSRT